MCESCREKKKKYTFPDVRMLHARCKNRSEVTGQQCVAVWLRMRANASPRCGGQRRRPGRAAGSRLRKEQAAASCRAAGSGSVQAGLETNARPQTLLLFSNFRGHCLHIVLCLFL
jgi:hypothetical protein